MRFGDSLRRFWWLRGNVVAGEGVKVQGPVSCSGKGVVRLGAGVELRATTAPIHLLAQEGAEIVLGDGVVVEAGCSIEAVQSVRVGDRARLEAFSKVLDNHFHQLGDHLSRPPSRPVVVEEDAVIGPRAILLPGAHVGRGARVGPATIISRRTPPEVEICGNPPTMRALR